MTRRLELALHALVVVEFAVDDDVEPLVLVGDRLIARVQVDDAEPRVSEADVPVRCDPEPASVRPAMVEPPRGAFQHLRVDGIAAGPECDDAAHAGALYCTRAVTDSGVRAGLDGVEVHRVVGKPGARRQPSAIEAATPARGQDPAHRARNTARRMPEPSPRKVRLPLARDPCRLDRTSHL